LVTGDVVAAASPMVVPFAGAAVVGDAPDRAKPIATRAARTVIFMDSLLGYVSECLSRAPKAIYATAHAAIESRVRDAPSAAALSCDLFVSSYGRMTVKQKCHVSSLRTNAA
jgi:hypothetical protein